MDTESLTQKAVKQALTPRLSFDCFVNGKRLKGFFYEETNDNPVHRTLEIGFSNNYHTLFLVDDNGYWYDESNSKSPYPFAIKDDLNLLLFYSRDGFATCFPIKKENESFNVFVFEQGREEIGSVLNIYYKNDYRFSLKKINNKWHWSTTRKVYPEIMNEEMTKLVIAEIEKVYL